MKKVKKIEKVEKVSPPTLIRINTRIRPDQKEFMRKRAHCGPRKSRPTEGDVFRRLLDIGIKASKR